jgi:quinoprotein glucose dehydrogenase
LLSERVMWGLTPLDQLWCRVKFREARYDGPLTPPGIRPTITYPGYAGGINWGSVSVDPERRLMVVNWNRVPNYERLIPRAEADAMGVVISENGVTQTAFGRPAPQMGTPFALSEVFFMSPIFVPCIEPPFGNIAVVDLDQHKIRWQSALGSSVDTGPLGMASHLRLPMGVPAVGGAITTKSGLVFIAAAMDREIRAFDIRDGRKLWTHDLPEAGYATPMSFVGPSSGRQFVVITAGGNGSRVSSGEYLIAYALPVSTGPKP